MKYEDNNEIERTGKWKSCAKYMFLKLSRENQPIYQFGIL